MTVLRPPAASCTVRVYKAGLLSAVGHDLELRVRRFSLLVEDGNITGEFDGTSLEVVGALDGDAVVPGKLSDKDQRDILDNIRKSVFAGLQPAQITFECADFEQDEDGIEGTGTLTIPPRSRALRFRVEAEDGRARCLVRLHQPDFGITPYKAPLGVLKIKPELEVRIEVPWTR